MTDEQKRKLEIPWGTLLPIVAALAGIIAQYRPLVSVRPAVPGAKVTGHAADQDVDARLWQDPLSVVQKAKTDLEESLAKNPPKRNDRHSVAALKTLLEKSPSNGNVLILPVMLDSGPYLEQAESRLRARQAVLEALSEADFLPIDGEHIGFVFEPHWPVPLANGTSDAGKDTPLFFSWEQCSREPDLTKRRPENRYKGSEFTRILILWLPAARFNPLPLHNLVLLLKDLEGNYPVRLIGPANSNGLQAMYREIIDSPFEETAGDYGTLLDRVKIFSARATASDEWFTSKPNDACQSLEDEIEAGVRKHKWAAENFEFVRTILPDDVVLRALIDELALRHVHVSAWKDDSGPQWKNGDHIVILSEWDSAYGRALSDTFQDEARQSRPADAPECCQARINPYRYMHGIDGRLPSDSAKENDSAKKEENPPTEATEGSNQSDFLRRLAKSLKQQEQGWLNSGEGDIKAIGILGSDIYDKLMVLRALRPIFPNAIFFTNNYDAHFERLDEWDDVHNLIVASPFTGLAQEQKDLAPFRDNNQTSMYVGTLRALGKITTPVELTPPHLFEVGRRGVYELIVPSNRATSAPSCTPTPTPKPPIESVAAPAATASPCPPSCASPSASKASSDEYADWLHAPGRVNALIRAGVGLVLLAAWIILSMADRRLRGGGDPWPKLKRALTSTPVWLLVGVPVIILSVASCATRGEAALEPLKFFSGISIWPSEMLRLIALLLAIHFLIKAHVDLKLNERGVIRRFGLGELPGKWRWRKLRVGLRRWHKEHPEWMKEKAPLTAKEAWMAYLWRNHFWPRTIRVTALVAIYSLFAFGVFALFPQPLPPARGDAAFSADSWILKAAVFGLMVLTFYVVDAIRLTSSLIRIVTGGMTDWEDAQAEVAGGRIPPLTNEDLARYYDIAFVAERTEVIARLIWYPLIVLALMILARSAYFDNWTWPYSLLLILCLNALWAFGAAALLRRAAEQLRTEAIAKLQALRAASYEKPQRREIFDDLIAEIRALKRGAFAPLSEQPFIRAIIVPSGGLGLVAVAQRFLEIF